MLPVISAVRIPRIQNQVCSETGKPEWCNRIGEKKISFNASIITSFFKFNAMVA